MNAVYRYNGIGRRRDPYNPVALSFVGKLIAVSYGSSPSYSLSLYLSIGRSHFRLDRDRFDDIPERCGLKRDRRSLALALPIQSSSSIIE